MPACTPQVDLRAATSKARARSMQAIRAGKVERARAYHCALADRADLPRFLRLLDLRLAGALADSAAAAVGDAAAALRAAAPRLHEQQLGIALGSGCGAGCEGQGTSEDEDGAAAESTSRANGTSDASSPAFLCSIVIAEDGSLQLSPGEAQWAAAVEEQVVGGALALARAPLLLSLPAFERYQGVLLGTAGEVAGEAARSVGAAELAQRDPAFTAGTAEMRALLKASFAEARRLVAAYHRCLAVREFEQAFDHEAWAQAQGAALDVAATQSLLCQLAGWAELLQGLPLSQPAGLLCLDAVGLQAHLVPVVSTAQERISGLLLHLAGERCRTLVGEMVRWHKVAAARPLDIDAFLAWSAELARLQAGAGAQLAAAADIDAALELVAAEGPGRLPTADAVKKDDLREVAAALPGALDAAAAWVEQQRLAHGALVMEQARGVAEEAVQLDCGVQVGSGWGGEGRVGATLLCAARSQASRAACARACAASTTVSPLARAQAGVYVDAGAASAEVLAQVELQRAHLARLVAQAHELARLARELGGLPGGGAQGPQGGVPPEVESAEAAVQVRCMGAAGLRQLAGPPPPLITAVCGLLAGSVPSAPVPSPCLQGCADLWGLVAEAEALQQQQQAGQDVSPAEAEALQERLAALRGNDSPPSSVWLRASTAVLGLKVQGGAK